MSAPKYWWIQDHGTRKVQAGFRNSGAKAFLQTHRSKTTAKLAKVSSLAGLRCTVLTLAAITY